LGIARGYGRHGRCHVAATYGVEGFDRKKFYDRRKDFMNSTNTPRLAAAALLLCVLALAPNVARAQSAQVKQDYSDSDTRSRARSTTTNAARRRDENASETEALRDARTIFIAPNTHIDAEYLEYKLDKLPEFDAWQLSIVKDRDKADLVIEINKTALNYIFSVVDPRSSAVVVKGKVVAVNGLVAAEDISHEIVRRMKEKRALP
jgi:hypothetical protein